MPYAAVMTCSDADKNCPFIPGAEKRISLPFKDPKEFDDTLIEAKKYKECSLKIASEVFYVFNEVDKSFNPNKFKTNREKYVIVNQLDIFEKIYIKI